MCLAELWVLIIRFLLASDSRMREGVRHCLTDTHSLQVGKNGENGTDSNQGEVETFVTIAHLSSSSALLIADQRGIADLIYLEINQRNVLE